jgi:tetratricopeptide (TPR) repeat protein
LKWIFDLRRLLLSFASSTIILLSGCAVGDFVGAYFNTYYNAQRAFTEAEQEVLTPTLAQGATRAERMFLAPFEASAQAKTKFATVIEKCSKLLQYHPESKLVDDALLMIGKSYYYQNEHQSAERKFTEILTSFPESDLRFETKLLLAQTLYRRNDKQAALSAGMELLDEAKKEEEEAIIARTANLLGHIAAENANHDEALQYYQLVAEFGETSEERAAAHRAIANIRILQSNFAAAFDSYGRSADASGDYVGVYLGEIGQARMLSKLGKHEEALARLGTFIKNTNYREFFGEIDLALANAYRDEEDYESAEAQYRYVDTAYARTEVAALAYYELGQLYETKLFNYDSARVAYEKGKGEFPQAPITVELLKRSELMNRYAQYRSELAKYDSLREFIATQPRVAIRDSSNADSAKKHVVRDTTTVDSTKNFGVREITRTDSTLALATPDSARQVAPSIPPPPIDAVMTRLADNKSELASLFYSGLGILDSAKYWYQRLLDDHRLSGFAARALFTLAQIYRADSTVSSSRVDSLNAEIVKRFPESEFAIESRRHLKLPEARKESDIVEAKYLQAEALSKKGDISAALRSLKDIADRDSTSPFAAKAQYTVGWIYENIEPNSDSSIANYQRLVKRFPASQYVALVQPKLAEVESEKQKQIQEAQRDSLSKLPVTPPDSGATIINKDLQETPLVPPTKGVRKDSVMDEFPILKEQPKKDEEPPKPE